MEIEHSILWEIIAEVLDKGQTTTNYGWRAEIHYTDFQEGKKRKTYYPMFVTGVTLERDYFSGFTDNLILTVIMPLGKYAHRVYPSRRELEVTLIKEPQVEGSLEEDADNPVVTERFLATLIRGGPAPAELQGLESKDEEQLDYRELVEVQFQLRNHLIDQLRLMTVGGAYRKIKMFDLIRAILTKEPKKAQVDAERKLLGVNMVPPSNEQEREQVLFNHMTPLADVPGYLQKEVGVYNSSLGHFIQGRHWFVYPLHDCEEYTKRQYTGTIVIVPQHKLSNSERTFMKKANSVTILVTGQTGFQDDDGIQYLNQGNGTRYTDAAQMVEQMGRSSNNKLLTERKKINSEYVSEDYKQMPHLEKLYHAPLAKQRVTANPFPILSALNARRGAYFKCVWENHDSNLLIPGMPFRVLTLEGDDVIEYRGILHRVDNVSVKAGHMGVLKYNHQAVLYIYLRKFPFE